MDFENGPFCVRKRHRQDNNSADRPSEAVPLFAGSGYDPNAIAEGAKPDAELSLHRI